MFAIPTTLREYRLDVAERRNSFARSMGPEERFRAELEGTFRETVRYLRALGVGVHQGSGLRDARSAFARKSPVVVLYSHWDDDFGRIEFRDGLKQPGEVVDAIPEQFDGLIDLTVCHPLALVDQIRVKRQRAHVQWSEHNLTARFWPWFYVALFKLLAESRVSYLDAYETVERDFRVRSGVIA